MDENRRISLTEMKTERWGHPVPETTCVSGNYV